LEEGLYLAGNKYVLRMILTSIDKEFPIAIRFKYAETEYEGVLMTPYMIMRKY